MKRKEFIYSTIGAANLTALSACAIIPEKPIEWQMASTWSGDLDIRYKFGVKGFCELVSELTNGRLKITPYPAGANERVTDPLKVFEAVEQGKAECGHTSSYYNNDDRNSPLWFATAVPFGLNAQQQNAWLYEGGGLEELNKICEARGVKIFPAGNTGAQMGGWFQNPVERLDDLKGLPMRIPGLGGRVMKEMGVIPVDVAPNEIYQAFQNKKIRAAEFVGPYDDKQLRLHEVASFYYYPGWWEPSSTLLVVVNLKAWNKLPREYQKIFQAAAFEYNTRVLARYDVFNRKALKELKDDYNIRLMPYSKEILNKARSIAFDIYDRLKDNSEFQQIYESWNNFRVQVSNWHRINEYSLIKIEEE
ncbi:TRAP transporter substrate-binding protein [Scytonema sp. NUACC21]